MQRPALAHDGTPIPYAVLGRGPRNLFFGPGAVAASQVAAHDQWVEGLGKDFRLILIDYPGEPKMYTLTPAAVSRDYLAVADAVGAARFAYYGYSWGAVTGLQLALRTNRLTALVAGGFPMIDGPYAAMLRLCHLMEQGPVKASYFEIPWMPESARQFVTYYEGLRTFDDRAAQPRLSCPRLTFAGTADLIAANGEVVANIGQTVADRKAELDQAGWEVRLLEGLDHLGAAAPGAVIPLIGEWLRRSVPA